MILRVDDSRQMRETLKDMLREISSQFCECENGEDAVEMFRVCRPEWVLMDIKMPGMDGIAATRQIKELDPEARIVVVSNYDDPILREDAAAAGAIGYVAKDDLSVLRQMLGE
jgi:two-component system chemotaxis response regulator CheY